MRAVTVAVTGTCVTGSMSAILAATDPGLLAVYLPTCGTVYGGAALVALVVRARREEWHWRTLARLLAQSEEVDADPGPATDRPADSGACESCRKRPIVRTLLIEGHAFAVCDSCTPPTPASPFVPQVVR